MARSKDLLNANDPFARRTIKQRHFEENQPPLLASKFLSYASDAAAHDAEAHGQPHAPDPTYLTLVLEDCLPLEKVKDIIASQVPDLEPVREEEAKLGLWGEEDVKLCRIRGAIKGWYNVLQDILTDDGDIYYLKKVPLLYEGQTIAAYRPTEHFPRPKKQVRKSVDSTPRSKSFEDGHADRRKSTFGKYLHWHRKSQDTPRSHSVS